MSALLDDGTALPGRPLLGALLVQRGLLTGDQLEAALAEQGRTQRPLGEVLIALGFMSAATVAQALATQHGGLLKTEYGYATGFGAAPPAVVADMQPATSEQPVPAVAPASAQPAATSALPAPEAPHAAEPLPVSVFPGERVRRLEVERDAARVEVAAASAAAAEARIPEFSAELEGRPAEVVDTWSEQIAALERHLDEAFATVASLTGERDVYAATVVERDTMIDRLREVTDELYERVARLETVEAELDEARAAALASPSGSFDAEAFTNRIAELEDALVVEVAAKSELETAVSERDEQIRVLEELVREQQPWAASERHLLFFRAATGYALIQQDGPPPLPGARIEVAGADGLQVVTRVAPAPLPGHALPCAYLVAA